MAITVQRGGKRNSHKKGKSHRKSPKKGGASKRSHRKSARRGGSKKRTSRRR